MSLSLPFNFSDPLSIDLFLAYLIAFAIFSVVLRFFVRKAWGTRIGATTFILILVIGAILIYLDQLEIGIIFILIFGYFAFMILANPARRDKHEN